MKIFEHPIFVTLAVIGFIDIAVQAITQGRVRLIHRIALSILAP